MLDVQNRQLGLMRYSCHMNVCRSYPNACVRGRAWTRPGFYDRYTPWAKMLTTIEWSLSRALQLLIRAGPCLGFVGQGIYTVAAR